MAIAFATAADILKCQTVRDTAIPVLQAFQAASQSNSNVPYTAAEIQALVTTLEAALQAVGATTTSAANQVTLTSGVTVNAVAVTGSGNFATPTIVNGAITGIVLSAS